MFLLVLLLCPGELLRVNDYQLWLGFCRAVTVALMGRHVTHSPMSNGFLRKPWRQREAEPGVSVTLLFHATEPPLGPNWIPLIRGTSCHRAALAQDALSEWGAAVDAPPGSSPGWRATPAAVLAALYQFSCLPLQGGEGAGQGAPPDLRATAGHTGPRRDPAPEGRPVEPAADPLTHVLPFLSFLFTRGCA